LGKFCFRDIRLLHFLGYLKGDNSFGCDRFSIFDESLVTKKIIKITPKALFLNHWAPLNFERRSRAT